MGEGLAEWTITTAGDEQTILQMAYFDRSREPVIMEIGPVLALEDVAGGKVCALASRVEVRDYADTARMLDRYSTARLIGLARRLDPGLTAEDFADAGRQLDSMADEEFSRYGLSQQDVASLRAKFASWPRNRQDVSWELPASERRHPGAGLENRSAPTREGPDPGRNAPNIGH